MVGGTIVAIHAIHRSNRVFAQIVGELGIAIFRDCAPRIRESHPRDNLPLFVGRNIFDLVGQIHVPMNAACRTMRGITPTHFQNQPDGEGRVRFVREEVVIGAIEIARESLRPVASLASVLGRTQVFDGRLDRAIKFPNQRAVKLPDPVDL